MVTAVIFDIGGILEPNYSIVAELSAFLGTGDGVVRELLQRYHDPLSDGTMSLHDAYRSLADAGGTAVAPAEAAARHVELYRLATTTLDPRVVALIADLKRRYMVACLTNTEVEVARLNEARGYFRLFHRAYLSSSIGFHKPDPRIFRHVLGDLQAAPSEAVFIDDRSENVDGARAEGLHAIRYDGFEGCRSALRQLLGGDVGPGGETAPGGTRT